MKGTFLLFQSNAYSFFTATKCVPVFENNMIDGKIK